MKLVVEHNDVNLYPSSAKLNSSLCSSLVKWSAAVICVKKNKNRKLNFTFVFASASATAFAFIVGYNPSQ